MMKDKAGSSKASLKKPGARGKRMIPNKRHVPPASPPLPLSRHHLTPAVLRDMERWRGQAVDGTFIERIKEALDSESHVAAKVRDILDRVKFGGEIPPGFDSRGFYYLSNLLLTELLAVESGESPRREMDIEEAAGIIKRDWLARRLALLV